LLRNIEQTCYLEWLERQDDMKQKIYSQKSGALNEAERIEIAKLLIKAGYIVRVGKEKPPGKQSGANVYFIEYWEVSHNE